MKKKLLTATLFFAIVCPTLVWGQKNKTFEKAVQQAAVRSANDSIAYALGFSMAEQGMLQYLDKQGIVNDPAKFDLFLSGLRESMSANGQNSAYITGLSVGDQTIGMVQNFSKQSFEDESADNLNMVIVTRGIEDALLKKAKLIDNTEMIMEETMNKATQRAEEKQKIENAAKIEESNKFLEENAKKEGVVTLPSGLQYKIISQGTGDIPTGTDRVSVLYRGSLTDGTVFDDGYVRDSPTVLGVNQVIKGWTEALKLMPVGSKWELYIPYDLGYGSRGGGAGTIPAYSTLIFEIDLLGIEK